MQPPNLDPSLIGHHDNKQAAAATTTTLKDTSNDRDHHWVQPEKLAVAFGENKKAQMAVRAMFELVHQYGDNLREGWKNVLDCLLHLLRANLLPAQMMQIEDFVDFRGYIPLKELFIRRTVLPKKEESGLFSWLGFTSSSGTGESDQNRPPTKEEKEFCKLASNLIAECHPEQLVSDSRYLASSALTELINNIIQCSLALAPVPTSHPLPNQHEHGHAHQHHHHQQQESQGSQSQDDDSLVDLSAAASALLPDQRQKDGGAIAEQDEEQRHDQNALLQFHDPAKQPLVEQSSKASSAVAESHTSSGAKHPAAAMFSQAPVKLSIDEEEALVFLLELMAGIVLENRDRLAQVWPLIRDHLRWLLTQFPMNQQLMERAVVVIIRIANRNLFRLGQQQQQQSIPESGSRKPTIIDQSGDKGRLATTKSVVIVVEDEQQNDQSSNHQTIQHRTGHCADDVLQFMGSQLLSLRPPELFLFSRQIAFGLLVLLRVNAANVHSTEHWEMFFALLEAIGAAAYQEDDFDMVESNKQWHSHATKSQGRRVVRTKMARNSVQSDPEEMAATAVGKHQQLPVDDRGYCSDDPSLATLGLVGQIGAGISGTNVDGSRRRPENPLLAAAAIHREQLRLLSKADSGEWIHVVPGPTAAEQQQTRLATTEEEQEVQRTLTTGTGVVAAAMADNEQRVSSSPPFPPHSSPITTMPQTVAGNQSPTGMPMPTAQTIISAMVASQQTAGHPVAVLPPVQIVQVQSPQFPAVQAPSSQSIPAVAKTITTPSSSPPPIPPVPSSPAAAPAPIESAPALPPPPPHPRAGVFKRGTIVLAPNLSRHDPAAFLKVVETLTFLARDAAHITPANFSQFTHCLRMMVEASMDGGKCAPVQLPPSSSSNQQQPKTHSSASAASKQFPVPNEKQQKSEKAAEKQPLTETAPAEGGGTATAGEAGVEKMSEQERLANCYMDASLQLLNVCYQLHARAADIYRDWADTGTPPPTASSSFAYGHQHQQNSSSSNNELWASYWRPLLQAMARMSCDCRRRIRAQALDALAASFRVAALTELMHPSDWEDCFAEVLFPLLGRLLSGSPPISPMDPIGMEEARIRAIQLGCKILLSHLTPISKLATFPDLLRRIFDMVDQFLEENACSDLLSEVIQESLKNCVLVCENFGIFQGPLAGLQLEMKERLEGLAKKHGGSAGLKMAL